MIPRNSVVRKHSNKNLYKRVSQKIKAQSISPGKNLIIMPRTRAAI